MAADVRPDRNAFTVLHWAACFAVMLGLHVSVVLALLRHVILPAEPPAAVPATELAMLDLAPAAVTPTSEPASPPKQSQSLEPPPASEPPPAPEPQPPEPQPLKDSVPPQPEVTPPAQPEPQPQATVSPPLPAPAVALPEPPPPARPPPRRPAQRPPMLRQSPRPDQATALSTPEAAAAPPASAPAPSAAASANAVATWRGELIARLQRAKHYPDAARARDEQGVATVTFTMDRDGHLLSVTLVRSSGSQALDEEAVAMIRRAEPLPPMPAGLDGKTLVLTIPVTFSLQ